MSPKPARKATVDEIQRRFDADVERFSDVDAGQTSTMDARLVMDVIIETAQRLQPGAQSLLDIGCGAGNFAVRFRQVFPHLDVTLVDLSRPMLDRAEERLGRVNVRALQGDIRELDLGRHLYDLVVATAVLHHLRLAHEWLEVLAKIYEGLRPGGSFWGADLVHHAIPAVHEIQWRRYGDYLKSIRDEAYRDYVFDYIEYEDTPRPLLFQTDLLRQVGFTEVDVLHKNGPFAAWVALK